METTNPSAFIETTNPSFTETTNTYVIKKIDGIFLYKSKAIIEKIYEITRDICAVDGVIKGIGLVTKGSFVEEYHNSTITRVVKSGKLFSTNMGNTASVTVRAREVGSEMLVIMPDNLYPGGVVVTEYGRLDGDKTTNVTGDYLVVVGAGIIVDGVEYDGDDGFKLTEPKTIRGIAGTSYYLSYKLVADPEELKQIRSLIDRNDPAIIAG